MDREIATIASRHALVVREPFGDGDYRLHIEIEADATGEWTGTLVSTLITRGGARRSGTYDSDNALYFADGAVARGLGRGIFTANAGGWRLLGRALLGDGRVITTDASLDLERRTLSGKIYAHE